jgi:DNA-binding HxlR family transcriptional regulator
MSSPKTIRAINRARSNMRGSVEYALTPLGATLRQIVHALIEWSGAHLAEVDAARARYDAQERRWATPDTTSIERHA